MPAGQAEQVEAHGEGREVPAGQGKQDAAEVAPEGLEWRPSPQGSHEDELAPEGNLHLWQVDSCVAPPYG